MLFSKCPNVYLARFWLLCPFVCSYVPSGYEENSHKQIVKQNSSLLSPYFGFSFCYYLWIVVVEKRLGNHAIAEKKILIQAHISTARCTSMSFLCSYWPAPIMALYYLREHTSSLRCTYIWISPHSAIRCCVTTL